MTERQNQQEEAQTEEGRISPIQQPGNSFGSGGQSTDEKASQNNKITQIKVTINGEQVTLIQKAMGSYYSWYQKLILLKFQSKHQIVQYFPNTDNSAMIWMQKCQGGDLKQFLKQRKKPLSIKMIKNILSQLAIGIQYITKYKVVHCDIKPANIFIVSQNDSNKLNVQLPSKTETDPDQLNVQLPSKTETDPDQLNVQIGDFGISQLLFSGSLKGRRGTQGYWSPQASQCKEIYTFKTDVWSLGCVLYQLRYGQTPKLEKNTSTNTPGLKQSIFKEVQIPSIAKQINPQNQPDQHLKDLLSGMLRIQEKDRMSIAEVIAHPFLKDQALEIKNKGARQCANSPKEVPLQWKSYLKQLKQEIKFLLSFNKSIVAHKGFLMKDSTDYNFIRLTFLHQICSLQVVMKAWHLMFKACAWAEEKIGRKDLYLYQFMAIELCQIFPQILIDIDYAIDKTVMSLQQQQQEKYKQVISELKLTQNLQFFLRNFRTIRQIKSEAQFQSLDSISILGKELFRQLAGPISMNRTLLLPIDTKQILEMHNICLIYDIIILIQISTNINEHNLLKYAEDRNTTSSKILIKSIDNYYRAWFSGK